MALGLAVPAGQSSPQEPIVGGELTSPLSSSGGPPPFRFLYMSHDAASASVANGWNLIDLSSKSLADALPFGIQALYWLGDYSNGSCSWEQSDSTVTSVVQSLLADGKVYGYFFSDEPDPAACPNAPAQHLARHNLIRSLDPGKATVIVLDSNSEQASIDQYPLWVSKSDIQAIDPYPCRVSAPCDFAEMDRQISAARNAGLNYWIVAQAFNDSNWRWPTVEELGTILSKIQAENRGGYMVFAWTWAGNTLSSKPGLLALFKQFNTTGNTSPPPPAPPPPPPPPPPSPPPPVGPQPATRVVRCVVPRLKGKTLAAARRALVRGHCRLGKVTRTYSSTVRMGRVAAQRPAAGRRLVRGAKVKVFVSRGRRH